MAFQLALQMTQVILEETKTRLETKTRGSKLAIWIVKMYSNQDYGFQAFTITVRIGCLLLLECKQVIALSTTNIISTMV